MVREVLGLELNDMDFSERWRAIYYSWFSFNSKSQLYEAKERPKETLIEFDNSDLEAFEKEMALLSPEFLNQIESKINVGGKKDER